MQTNSPKLGLNVSAGHPSPTYDWVNPENITVSDGSYATASGDSSFDPNLLVAEAFSFSIPTGALVAGIVVALDRYCSSGASTSADGIIQLRKAGVAVGSNKASASTWPTNVGTATYGSSTDLWGTNWTVADINGINFGVEIMPIQTFSGTHTYNVDNARITVYYTLNELLALGAN